MSQIKPVNKVLVTIPKEFEDEIVTESGFRLYKDPSYSKEWNATITGKISMLSDLVSDENKPIFEELDLGVECCFDYKVVADFDFVSDSKNFIQASPEEIRHIRKYVNKEGYWLNVRSYPTHFGKKWVGWYQDRFMNTIDSVAGTESDLERWLSQFSFGKTDAFVFRNKIYVDKRPHWVVDYSQIIAKKVQDEWVALNGYAICLPLTVDITKKVSISAGGIHLPDSSLQMRFYDRAIMLNGAEDMGIQKYEVIAFEEKYLYKNIIEGVEYFFIKKNKIDGIYPPS